MPPEPKLLAEWFWVDRWMGSSAFLLPLEVRGLYREMLSQAWRRGGSLPNDPEAIQRAVGCTAKEWARAWPRVQRFWQIDGAVMFNVTQREVYTEALKAVDRTSSRASTAARARWDRQAKPGSGTDAHAHAQASPQANARADAQAGAPAHAQALLEQCPPSPSPSPTQRKDVPDRSPSEVDPAGTWGKVLAGIRAEVSPHTFHTWFVPCRVARETDALLELAVETSMIASWITEHFRELIDEQLQAVAPGKRWAVIVRPGQRVS